MLTSIAILAVVGGALAFKANRAQGFCTAPNIIPPAVFVTTDGAYCNVFVHSTVFNGHNLRYEFPTAGPGCDGIITCTADKLKIE